MHPPVRTGGRFRWWLLALVAVNLAARLPLIWDAAEVRNDGAEYLAIARSLRTVGRYETDLKWHFFTEEPVRHSAWGDRPPLYPAFAALCQQALPSLDPVAAARLGSVLFTLLALVLAALYLRGLYGETTALLATGYVFLLPNTLYWTAQPMTEGTSLALALGALIAWTWALGVGRWALGVGRWAVGGGRWAFGAGDLYSTFARGCAFDIA